MLFNSNKNRGNYTSIRRFFVILLFLNTFIGCVYFIHEQKREEITLDALNTSIWNNIFNRNLIKPIKPIKFIKNILENEYNKDDLIKFYDLVQKEYSLGLKCTRNTHISQSITISNTNNQIENTTISSSFSSANEFHSRRHRFQRANLNKYLIDNSDACLDESVDLVVGIISKSDNYKTRDAIRRTWGSGKNLGIYQSINIKFFFLIDFNEQYSKSVELENELFHDIIQVELPQQYGLVTYRVLSLFEWTFRYCHQAKYLFKTDDDVFINTILLLRFVSSLINQPIDNSFMVSNMTIYGYVFNKLGVTRNTNDLILGRYTITPDEFPCQRYPKFLSGFGYLISKKARDAILYTAYQDPQPFRISDVYLTGIIPDYISMPREAMPHHYIRYFGGCDNSFNTTKPFACAIDSHRGISVDVFQKFYQYWQFITKNLNLFIN